MSMWLVTEFQGLYLEQVKMQFLLKVRFHHKR